MNLLGKHFRGKKVLILGHTGFKGSWLVLWLSKLGAEIVGASRDIPTSPSHYEEARVDEMCKSLRIDIRDKDSVEELIGNVQPDFVFQLAAQSLVGRAYRDPVETFATNVLGTVHLLESLRKLNSHCVAIIVTSDKCYENVEVVHGYRETDRLGGKDPYSASKGAAELSIRGYIQSFFQDKDCPVKVGIGRAGNVVGGGDWAEDRLVPDFVRAWVDKKTLQIRQPHSTRPWQHVLEPLSGYLWLAAELSHRPELHGEPFNFGPRPQDTATVEEVVGELSKTLDGAHYRELSEGPLAGVHEAGLLKLSCDKALHALKWQPVYSLDEALVTTATWYKTYYSRSTDVRSLTRDQIDRYCESAAHRGHVWAR